jgi:hypothetical protein
MILKTNALEWLDKKGLNGLKKNQPFLHDLELLLREKKHFEKKTKEAIEPLIEYLEVERGYTSDESEAIELLGYLEPLKKLNKKL